MVVRNSLLSAMCVAGLLGVVAVNPAAAITNTISVVPALSIVTGPTTSVTVTSTTAGTTFTSGLTISPGFFPVIGVLPVYSGTGTYVDVVTFDTSAAAPGLYIANASFTSFDGLLNGGANQDFAFVVPGTVPEPGTIAFGVIAAGSVMGLVARKRKKA